MNINDEDWINHLRDRLEREKKADIAWRNFIDMCNSTPFEPIGESPKCEPYSSRH